MRAMKVVGMTGATCAVDGCGRAARTRGWCSMHYTRWQRHGDVNFTMVATDPEDAFSRYVQRVDSCLEWIGYRNNNGYGVMRVGGQPVYAHRYAWERVNGAIPSGLVVDHRCHNRACVNVEHLRVATQRQNMWNLEGARADNTTSHVRDVEKNHKRWAVRIGKDGRRHYFGTYDTIAEAREVAKRERLRLFGQYAGRG